MNEAQRSERRVDRLVSPLAPRGVVRACEEMAEAEAREEYEDAEIVGAGIEYWLGLRRVSARTVNTMLRLCLVSVTGIGTRCERFTLNEDGREFAKDPANYVPRILRANYRYADDPQSNPSR